MRYKTFIGLLSACLMVSLYVNDTNSKENEKLNKQIQRQNKIFETNSETERKQRELLKNKSWENKVLREQLNKLKQENNKAKSQLASRGEQKNYRQFYVSATAYINKCVGCSGITYSGVSVKNTIEYNGLAIVAMDLSIVPLYSIVRIDFDGKSIYGIVLDKGGLIKNYKMDLLVNSYDEAIQFGRKKALITVLREGKG